MKTGVGGAPRIGESAKRGAWPRTLPAPRAAVYKALTDPEDLGKWWGALNIVSTTGPEKRIPMKKQALRPS